MDQGHYKVKKAMEFRTEPGTKKKQYRIRLQGYSEADDSWINAEDISWDVLAEFWKSGNKGATYRRRRERKTRDGNTRPETIEMIKKEKERILKGISETAQNIKTASQHLFSQLPQKTLCKFCYQFGHQTEYCKRAPWIAQQNQCCLRCLEKGHKETECKSYIMCWYCKSFNHNTFVCPYFQISQDSQTFRQPGPVYIHHYLDDSIIGHEECSSDLTFNIKERIWFIPSE